MLVARSGVWQAIASDQHLPAPQLSQPLLEMVCEARRQSDGGQHAGESASWKHRTAGNVKVLEPVNLAVGVGTPYRGSSAMRVVPM